MRTLLAGLAAFLPLLAQVPAAPNQEGVAMGHLHILTSDPDGHRKLWVDTLGGKAAKEGNTEFILIRDVVIMLRKGQPSAGSEGSVVDHVGFWVKDLDATKAKVTEAGAKVASENAQARKMFVMFPDAFKVEFLEDKALDIPIAFHHIHFASNQVDEMRAWYAKMLGATPGMRERFKTADVPGVNLSWNVAQTALPPSKGRSMDHIGFEVRDLKAFIAKLESQGVKFDVPYRDVPALKLKIAFFTDPWGTWVELTEGLPHR
jgi:catechol 2,3-dioxygenase-like lactoylglutathione lyase family enzyme